MNNDVFKPETYFDTKDIFFADIFEGVENIWEVIPRIGAYISGQLEKNTTYANYNKEDNIFIGEGTVVEEGAKILGPAIIGKNCSISHTAFIRENCIIGDNAYVGHAVEIKNSVILNNSRVPHLSYVGDSIIGNNVNLGGGAKTANFRLDKRNVLVKIGDRKIETGLAKFGAILGDNVSIGLNVVLNPGTILGKDSIVYPLVSVTGVHERGSVIR